MCHYSARAASLGLHLVKVQAQSMGGDVTILDRPEGGCGFRVQLVPASGDELLVQDPGLE